MREAKLTISPEARYDEKNRASGEVEAKHFLGEWIRYTVKLTNGDILAVRVPISSDIVSISEGDWVSVSFDPSHTYVYEFPAQGLKRELEAY
jgi:ABC-type Fe3+/spermidine/putrescine transport system ATPase subunit